MNRTLIGLGLAAAVLAGGSSARADRALLAPTGDTLPAKAAKYELALRGSDDSEIYQWVHVGLKNVEVQALYDNPASGQAHWGLGFQGAIFPGTMSLPAISAGVRDIADDTRQGRAFYVATGVQLRASPILPRLFTGARVDAGLGADGIKGAFGSLQLQAGRHSTFTGEFDSQRFNFGLDLNVGRYMKARAASLHGDMFYGLVIRVGSVSSAGPDISDIGDLEF